MEPESDNENLEFIPESDTTCTLCYAEFLDYNDLKIHEEQFHKIKKKTCQLCGTTYKDLFDYAAHIRDKHLLDLKCCSYCQKVFLNSQQLGLHQKKHVCHSKTLFSCSQCSGMFSNVRQLELHEHSEHNNSTDGIYLECMPYLSSILHFKVAPLFHPTADKFFICIACDFSSIDFKSYLQHLNDDNCQTYTCSHCSNTYKRKKHLIRHLRTNKCNTFNETVFCRHCSQKIHFMQLKDHLHCPLIKCKQCEETFDSVEDLSVHQVMTHPRCVKEVKNCPLCTRVYIGESSFKKHFRRTHKPHLHLYKYMCKICNAIFQHPHKLFVHYFMNHKDLEPYTCNICDKKFRIRKQFTLHIKLKHKSEGFVEFNDQYLVFFTDTKSVKPFVPKPVVNEADYNVSSTEEESGSEEEKTVEKKQKTPLKRKGKPITIYSSDDEPLLEVKKRVLNKNYTPNSNLRNTLKRQKRFTCNTCLKYCYTFQNYQNHMKLHKKNEKISCIKCELHFKTRDEFEEHVNNEHSSSLLTETLKKVLQKKKQQDQPEIQAKRQTPETRNFASTIKKVECKKSSVPATIKLSNGNDTDISAKNFLETFTPEVSEGQLKFAVNPAVSIKKVQTPFYRESTIKMKKCPKQPDLNEKVPLKPPQKFTDRQIFKALVNIRMINTPPAYAEDNSNDNDNFDSFDYEERNIPEVAEEVMLEDEKTDETQKTAEFPSKIVVPELPKGYKNLHVATLQPQAPYYKIIKVQAENDPKQKQPKIKKGGGDSKVISLEDGTKLVAANPLAHLLGDTPINSNKPNKYYKPVVNFDVTDVITKALSKLKDHVGKMPKKEKKSEENKAG